MKRHYLGIAGLIISVFFITLFLYGAKQVAAEPVAAQQGATAAQATYSPDELLVKTKKGINSYSFNAVEGAFILRQHAKSAVSTVKLPPGTDLQAAIKKYKADPNVEYAEPNYLRRLNFVPNDPYLSQEWYIDKIHAKEAWDITRGNNQVVVAVIDSGVDYGHPDLQDKIVSPYNSMINSNSLADVMDDVGHGTIVAGEVAAAMDNGVGIAGVGGNIKVMPIKAGDINGLRDADIATGIYWAVGHGARVINMSFGGTSYSNTLMDAVNYAVYNQVVVIAAAGNDNTSVPSYPAAFPGVIGVAATTQTDERATFSNYGSYIDFSAPGVAIFSTTPRSGTVDNAPNYDWASGTSMASPIVAGLAGLILSVNPGLNNTEVFNAIYAGAQDLGPPGWDEYTGWGRVDAFKTLNLLAPPTMISINPANNSSDISIYKTITANFSKDILAGPNLSAITLKDETNNILQVNNSIAKTTLSIKPVKPLSFGKTYTLTIPAGAVKDTVYNSLQASYTAGFSTENYLHLIQLPFQVTDAVYDAAYSVMYATNKSQKKLYAINVSTGLVSTMDFVYMPESLELGQGAYSNELYVALLHREHDSMWGWENQNGSIGIINRSNFTLTGTIDIQIDPFGIVAGRDGCLYVTSGSGQWTIFDSYSRATGSRVGRMTQFMQKSYAKLHPSMEKVYTITTDVSPRDYSTANVSNGTFGVAYDSPYHGNYPLNTNFAISTLGLLTNGSGVIFSTAADRVKDMVYLANLGTGFEDIAFEDDSSKFYTLVPNTHDINVYNAVYFNYLDKLNIQGHGKRLFNSASGLTVLLEPDTPSADYLMGIQIIPKLSYSTPNLGSGNGGGSVPVVSSVNLDSGSYSLNIGNTHPTVVTAVYSDNSRYDVTQYATYNSSYPQVATISQRGTVTGVAPGSTIITATYGGHSAQANVAVITSVSSGTPVSGSTPGSGDTSGGSTGGGSTGGGSTSGGSTGGGSTSGSSTGGGSTGGGGGGAAPVAAPSISPVTNAEQKIFSSGGKLITPAATVIIPKGALITTKTITAFSIDQSWISIPRPAGHSYASEIIEFGPNGTVFAKPITITVKYDSTRIGLNDIFPYYLNEKKKVWERINGARIDRRNGTISFETTHFSKYTVMTPDKPNTNFSDTKNHWAKNLIVEYVSRGAISGVVPGKFGPDITITRAEFCKLLMVALNFDVNAPVNPFNDISEKDWFYSWVVSAAKMGIVHGSNYQFKPYAYITREEMAVMILKALDTKGKYIVSDDTLLKKFKDRAKVSGWAKDSVSQAVKGKIINGKSSTVLAPLDNATKAEAIAMVKKAENLLK